MHQSQQVYARNGFHFGFYEKGIIKQEEALRNMNDVIGRLLILKHGKPQKIFDAGCGVGATLRYLSTKYPQSHFTGISLGSNEIKLAKKMQKQQNINNVEFLKGNYTDTRLPDNFFDAAFALESISYAASKKDVVNEISRVLKPGGRIVIVDGFLNEGLPLNSFMQHAYMVDFKKRGYCGYGSIQELRMCLESAGFIDITIRDLSKNIMGYYLFGGVFSGLFCFLSSELKRLISHKKGKSDKDSHTIMKGVDFVELLLGATKKIGYYAIIATKKYTV